MKITDNLNHDQHLSFEAYVKENSDKAETFLLSCFLQHNRIKVPDITPTNFGCVVQNKILKELIKSLP